MIPVLFFLSLIGGFCAGFLGIGGAVVLIPLMLSVPPLFGLEPLTINEISGITMIQVLASSITGCLTHRRSGFAHTHTILVIGIPMGICALFGATLSKEMDSQIMMIIFGCLVVIAFLMLTKRAVGEREGDSHEFDFKPVISGITGGAVGIVSGLLGAGGGFILIPLMIRVLKIPMRVAVGSSLGIVFIGALMGSIGKIVTLQVNWIYILPVIAASIPASLLGAKVSKKAPAAYIRYTLMVVMLFVMLKIWIDILRPYLNW